MRVTIRSPLKSTANFAWLGLYTFTTILWFGSQPNSACAQSGNAPVVVADITEVPVLTGYRVIGTVRPLRTSTIGSAAAGRVDKFLTDVGKPVKAGELIAELKTETLEIELAAANAELRLYEQQLAEYKNGSRPEEIAEALANTNQAQAAMENAAQQLKRISALADRGAATTADQEDARERANITKFAHAAFLATLDRVKEGPRPEQVAQRQAEFELQRQRVLLIEDRIRKHSLYAPFDGFVAEEFTEVGAWISSGDPIVRIVQLNEVEVEVPVTAEYVSKLKMGDSIRVQLFERPDILLTGKLDRVVPLTETRSRTYPVFIRLRNEFEGSRPALMAGMLAEVDLPAGNQRILPLVPKDALVLKGNQASVFVVEESQPASDSGIVRAVPVKLGVAAGNRIQVEGDLQAGQKVVIIGNERLAPNQSVSIIPNGSGTAASP